MSAAESTHPHHPHVPPPGEPTIPELEDDEDIPPRPEEEIADIMRAKPDAGTGRTAH